MPVYLQLGERIRLLIHEGALRVGDGLPTVRALAVHLGVNANTVARVYRELQRERLLRLERGVGTFVADGAGRPVSKQKFQRLEKKTGELIRLAAGAGLTASELAQFVETRWKEHDDVSK